MLTLRVGSREEYKTITQALNAVPAEQPLTLLLAAETFHEKIFCQRPMLHLRGAGRERTRILWQDAAFARHADGRKNGTFRSYTAFFDGECLLLEDLTIENRAGVGPEVGQAVAASLHARWVECRRVGFLSYQDTLFLAPLPEKEREPDGFLGPRQTAPREQTWGCYENCYIAGDIDFIFGGGSAVFWHCHIHGRGERRGFIAAPCTQPGALGFCFLQCRVTADQPGGLLLARPWRGLARAAFLDCELGNAVAPEGFDPWQEKQPSYRFILEPQSWQGLECRQPISAGEADALRAQAQALARQVRQKCRLLDVLC